MNIEDVKANAEKVKSEAVAVASKAETAFEFFKRYALYVAVGLFAFALGWFMCCKFGANIVEVEKVVTKEIPVEIPVEVKGDTQIVYVEKESEDDADVQIRDDKPVVSVEFNGQKTEFETLDNETQKFEKGKLQVEKTTNVNLDVAPIVDREVNRAVETQKQIDEKDKSEAVKEEKKKSTKHTVNGVLGGLGAGLLIGLLL